MLVTVSEECDQKILKLKEQEKKGEIIFVLIITICHLLNFISKSFKIYLRLR